MNSLAEVQRNNPALAKKIGEKQMMFVLAEDVAQLIAINRLMPVLVRCGNGRLTCPIQDLNHWMNIIEDHARLEEADCVARGVKKPIYGDHVRDVSLVG